MQEGTQTENVFAIESAAVSDRGLNESRPQNEDSYLDLPERGIFAVADGVGGAQAGEVASQTAIEILGEAFTNMPETSDAEEVMRAAFVKANEAIFEMANEVPQLSKMATTIVAVHVRGDVATIGHVGDSRAYRIDQRGIIRQETLDHSIVAEEVRAGRMTEEEAAVHPSRNIISRALGAEPSVEIDLKTILIEPGSSFLLCTDGITRHVANDEITNILKNGSEAAVSCGKLKDLCFERGAEDNLTAVVVKVGQAPHKDEITLDTVHIVDDDEDTIATARATPPDPEPDPAAVVEPASTVETASPTRFEIVDDQEEAIDFEPETPEPELVDSNDVTAEEDASADLMASSLRPGAVEASAPSFAAVEPAPESSRSRGIFLPLLFLVLGAAGGFGGFYAWSQAHPPAPVVAEAPVIKEMKTTDIPLTTFEESRRLVDKDPKKFIAANPIPQEAQDYFLLGRAYLLTGEYYLAKNAFNTAKGRLSEIDVKDRQTIANEIEMALAIIASGPATENFSKAIANANTAAANSNSTLPAANR